MINWRGHKKYFFSPFLSLFLMLAIESKHGMTLWGNHRPCRPKSSEFESGHGIKTIAWEKWPRIRNEMIWINKRKRWLKIWWCSSAAEAVIFLKIVKRSNAKDLKNGTHKWLMIPYNCQKMKHFCSAEIQRIAWTEDFCCSAFECRRKVDGQRGS